MKIGITADSTGDIPSKFLKKYSFIRIIPITIIMGDKEYREGVGIDQNAIYDHVNKGGDLPTTAAVNSYEYEEVFKEERKKYDAIIHFALSSGVSSTCSNAMAAAKNVDNVFVIDTKSLTSGSGLLAISCAEKITAGKDLTTILDEIKSEIDKVHASFIIAKLDYLRKGGRCSGIVAFGANLLKLKIRVELVDGFMKPTKKHMGQFNDVVLKDAEEILTTDKPDLKRVVIITSSPVPETSKLVVDFLKQKGFEEIIEQPAGATICCHAGEGVVGIIYFKK